MINCLSNTTTLAFPDRDWNFRQNRLPREKHKASTGLGPSRQSGWTLHTAFEDFCLSNPPPNKSRYFAAFAHAGNGLQIVFLIFSCLLF